MKKGVRILILILLFTIVLSSQAFAVNNQRDQQEIEIDGNFDDWEDKPYFKDYKRDIVNTSLNFREIRYFADEEYLYLYVQRQNAKKSQDWDFDLLILNAKKGRKYYGLIPTKYEYDRRRNYYIASKFKKAKYVKFDISTDYNYRRNYTGIPIKICINNQKIESRVSASNDNKRIEFRIPLERVGLEGGNKEIKFMLKSAFDIKAYKNGLYPYDWIANGKPIIMTSGSTFWQISAIVFFAAISAIIYRIYKKRVISDAVS